MDSDRISHSAVLKALPGLPITSGPAEAVLLAPGPSKPTAAVAKAKASTIKGGLLILLKLKMAPPDVQHMCKGSISQAGRI